MIYIEILDGNRIFADWGNQRQHDQNHAPDKDGAVGKIYVLEPGQIEA